MRRTAPGTKLGGGFAKFTRKLRMAGKSQIIIAREITKHPAIDQDAGAIAGNGVAADQPPLAAPGICIQRLERTLQPFRVPPHATAPAAPCPRRQALPRQLAALRRAARASPAARGRG